MCLFSYFSAVQDSYFIKTLTFQKIRGRGQILPLSQMTSLAANQNTREYEKWYRSDESHYYYVWGALILEHAGGSLSSWKMRVAI